MRHLLAVLLLATLNLPALAQARDAPLPRARPAAADSDAAVPLPRSRPAAEAPAVEAVEAAPQKADEAPAPPPRDYQSACPAMLAGAVTATALPPLREGQCTAASPLSVTALSVNGRDVPLSTPATTDCAMATTLPAWVAAVDSFLWARENARIAELLSGTSFMCRNVNNGAGGNLSFHGFASALDVIGFRLEDGRTVTVEGGWSDADSADGRLLRFAHDAACGIFTTTLGPEANAAHADHLHLDMGCHGASCTARLCE